MGSAGPGRGLRVPLRHPLGPERSERPGLGRVDRPPRASGSPGFKAMSRSRSLAAAALAAAQLAAWAAQAAAASALVAQAAQAAATSAASALASALAVTQASTALASSALAAAAPFANASALASAPVDYVPALLGKDVCQRLHPSRTPGGEGDDGVVRQLG